MRRQKQYINKNANRAIKHYLINCCTAITGFGLAGHSVEMAEASGVTFVIDIKNAPVIEDVFEYAQMGLVPAGAYRNRDYFKDRVVAEGVDEQYVDLAYDPQTSGGLLFSVNEKYAEEIMKRLKESLDTDFALVGRVIEKQKKCIVIKG